MRADGRMIMRPQSARAALFHDCRPDRAATAIALLRPQMPATGTQPAAAPHGAISRPATSGAPKTGCPTNSSAPPTGSTRATCSPCPLVTAPSGAGPTSSRTCCGRSSAVPGQIRPAEAARRLRPKVHELAIHQHRLDRRNSVRAAPAAITYPVT
jgi:hypothetical protein